MKTFVNHLILIIVVINFLFLPSCTKETVITPDNVEPPGQAPETPAIMQIIPISQEPRRAMGLMIYDASNNEDGFRIERKKQGESFSFLTNLTSDTESYDDWGVERSTNYTYRIRAYNQYGNSNWYEKSGISSGPETGYLLTYTTADTYVDEAYASTNFGGSSSLKISGTNGSWGGPQNGLILFSLPNLPSHATEFQSAYLQLCEAGGGNTTYPGPITIYAGEIVFDQWNENTVTWNTDPDAVFYPSIQYGTHNPNSIPCVTIDVSRTVSNWYSNVIPNRGFKLSSSSQTYCSYYSKEGYSSGSALLAIYYLW